MKKIKQLSRNDLKNLKGGQVPASMCSPGKNDTCGQYGLECGIFYGKDYANGTWTAWRCI